MKVFALVACALFAGCSPAEGRVFTLYRNSAMNEHMRLHVATFDADDSVTCPVSSYQ